MRAASIGLYSQERRGPGHRRWLPALALSLLVHAWLAWELPAGSLEPGAGHRLLEVHLAPREPPQAASEEAAVALAPDIGASSPAPLALRVPRRPSTRAPVAARSYGQRSADGTEATLSLAPAADATYYPARQLDVYPAPLTPLAVPYPERALQDNRAGRALVMLLIDAYGKVDEVAVVEAEPAGYFEEAAMKTFEHVRFSAARRNGLPVRSRVLIHLNFDPAERATAAR